MSIMSFLSPPKKAGGVQKQIDEMTAALAKLVAERREIEEAVEAHDQKRGQMLLSSASEEDILALDRQCDLAKLRSERLGLAQFELENRIERARDKSARERVAGELERDAAATETAAKPFEAWAAQGAALFDDFVKALPPDPQIMKPASAHMPPAAATREDVARAVLASALYNAAPAIFEQLACRPHLARMGGAAIERALHVCTLEAGLLTTRNAGLCGEEAAIHPATIVADQLIVAPLREKARTLRAGAAELLRAAE